MIGRRAAASVEAVCREERGRLLAMLVRQFGDLDLAEDAASDAIEAALERWPVDGVPATPLAWLLTTARRKAVDRLRRDKAQAARLAIMYVETRQGGAAAPELETGDLAHARLRLFFTCCHPALSTEPPGSTRRASWCLSRTRTAGGGTPSASLKAATWSLLPCAGLAQDRPRCRRRSRRCTMRPPTS